MRRGGQQEDWRLLVIGGGEGGLEAPRQALGSIGAPRSESCDSSGILVQAGRDVLDRLRAVVPCAFQLSALARR